MDTKLFSGKRLSAWKHYPWVVVGLLWVVALLNYMDRQMLSTMRGAMQIDIRELQSATNFGYLMAIFLWVYGFMNPVSGIVADKINRKWLITGSLFVWSSVTFAMGFVNSYNGLYLLRGIMGVSEALYMPAALSLIADYHFSKSRSLAVGIHMTGLYAGQALGGFGASVASSYSWQSTFQLFGLFGIVYSVLLLLFLYDKRSNSMVNAKDVKANPVKENLVKDLKAILTNAYFWLVLISFVVFSLPGWATKNWLPTLFAEKLSVDLSVAGPLATITIAASSLAGVITGGVLSDRWIQKNLRGRVYTGVIGFGLMIPALLLLWLGVDFFHFVLAGCLFGIGFGMYDANNVPILYQFVADRNRASAYGIMNMAGIFAGAIITNILGRFTDEGNLGSGFGILAIIVLIALLLQVFFLKPARQ